jgi:hypothetical protein
MVGAMPSPKLLLVPLFGSVALAFGGAAHAAAGGEAASAQPGSEAAVPEPTATPEPAAPTEAASPAPTEPEPEPEPEASSTAGTEVAGSQVEGEASVSSEGGFSGSASATGDGLRGTFGLGAIRTLSGLTGVNARYFVLDRLAIGLNVGVGTWTYNQDDPASTDTCPGPTCELEESRTVATLGLGLEALYFVKLGNPAGQLPFRADFGVGGRFNYFQGVNAADVPNNLDDSMEFDIEIPMVVQLRFGEHFVLSPEFGLNFVIVPGSRADGDFNQGTGKPDLVLAPDGTGPHNGPGFGFQITNGIGLFGGASLHYYF